MDGTQHNLGRLRAIIYVLLGQPESDRWEERCLAWCEQEGYDVDSIIREPDDHQRRGLAEGIRMLTEGRAEILVVATPEYLPDYWIPRFEVAWGGDPFAVASPPNRAPGGPPRQRRARQTRRG